MGCDPTTLPAASKTISPCGDDMPQDSPPLDNTAMGTISAWITQGALIN